MDESFILCWKARTLSILKLLGGVAVQVETGAVQVLPGQLFAQMKFPWEVYMDSEICFCGLGHVGLRGLLPDTAPVGFFMCKETD